MKFTDKELGMDRSITRRQFLDGIASAAAISAAPGSVLGAGDSAAGVVYPPLRTGLRGSHVGSFETAHELVWQGREDWGRPHDAGTCDLVVVGAGVSGLAAAWFYLQDRPDARILILDNHDDFGGHAKRNEFELDGRTLIGYGGSQALEAPGAYSAVAKNLLRDIGVDIRRFETAYDRGFYRRHGLSGGTYFDEETFGADRLVRYPLVDYSNWLPIARPSLEVAQAVSQMPITVNARRELQRLLEARGDHLQGMSAAEQARYLSSVSYRNFLRQDLGVSDPGVLKLYQGLTADSTVSIEATPALEATGYSGLPGLRATALVDYYADEEPYIYHFPDGNASIARLLVRRLLPRVAPGSTMDDVVLADFDYSKLDESGAGVRIRLNSTVVHVEHDGPAGRAKRLSATYVRNGRAFRVRAGSCVMAGYNAMVPHICPDLPEEQKRALGQAIKAPILYTNVLLRNWTAWKKLGIGIFGSPGGYYAVSVLDFPVSMGGYECSAGPDEPIIVHMERFAKGSDAAALPREQRLAGRREMYATPFEAIERATRGQLAGALAEGGFDPAQDIAGITVNRWGHGYGYSDNPLFDAVSDEAESPHVIGRRRFGRISIANADAGGQAALDAAIDEAHRAVQEISG